jgi:hypothetical protein
LNVIIRLSDVRRFGQGQDLPLQFVFRFIEICSKDIFEKSAPRQYRLSKLCALDLNNSGG